MFLKLIGGTIVIGGAYLYGLNLSETYLKRIKELKLLQRDLLIISNHISYAKMSLGESFEELSNKSKAPFNAFFANVAKDINSYDAGTIVDIFKKNAKIHLKTSNLTKEDVEKLITFAEILGYMDVELQTKNIKLYLEQLDNDIKQLNEVSNGKCKAYKCLCTALGIFVTIIII